MKTSSMSFQDPHGGDEIIMTFVSYGQSTQRQKGVQRQTTQSQSDFEINLFLAKTIAQGTNSKASIRSSLIFANTFDLRGE